MRRRRLMPQQMGEPGELIRVQLKIPAIIRNRLAERAATLGFNSIQAYLRFMIKAEIEGRSISHGEIFGPKGELAKRWEESLLKHYERSGAPPVPPMTKDTFRTIFYSEDTEI